MNPESAPSGILLVDKPAAMSSADVTNSLKKNLGFSKIGHGGTLDPFATGLLVVLVGEATKIARFLLEGDKEYEADALLGTSTTTGDIDGEAAESKAVPELSLEGWRTAASPFHGRIQQIPPAFSAIKVKGKPLYEYARKGQAVEIKSREVYIRELELLNNSPTSLRFRVTCSGGTYIRVLAEDIAKAAGTVAHLQSLRRLSSSKFHVKDAVSLEELLKGGRSAARLLPLEAALTHLPVVECDNLQTGKVRQGNLAVFDALRAQIQKPGYFLLVHRDTRAAIAVANHHPMMRPFCTIERVFDPRLPGT